MLPTEEQRLAKLISGLIIASSKRVRCSVFEFKQMERNACRKLFYFVTRRFPSADELDEMVYGR